MVQSVRTVDVQPNCGKVSSTAVCNNFTPLPNSWPGPLSPTPACYPLLSISPCVSEDRVLGEEGRGGIEVGSSITCMLGDQWSKVPHIVLSLACALTCH